MAANIRYQEQYAFVKFIAHGLSDGDVVDVRRATNSVYNGRFFSLFIDNDHFAYYIGEQTIDPTILDDGDPGVPIQIRSYSPTYFTGVFYSGIGLLDLVQDYATGYPLTLAMSNTYDVIPDAVSGGV